MTREARSFASRTNRRGGDGENGRKNRNRKERKMKMEEKQKAIIIPTPSFIIPPSWLYSAGNMRMIQ